jgi:hypothetical protein
VHVGRHSPGGTSTGRRQVCAVGKTTS